MPILGSDISQAIGLGTEAKSDWPTVVRVDEDKKPIDHLQPKSDRHRKVLDYLVGRIRDSEFKMGQFYDRWRVNEMKLQAYIALPDWEEQLRQLNNANEPPLAHRIIVPYSFATLSTITTFLLHAFTGRRPIFQVNSWKDETMDASRMMELKLQYDADHTRIVRELWQFFQDTQTYGVGIMRCLWSRKKEMRTVRRETRISTTEGFSGNRMIPVREERVVYEGNSVFAQDPFMFFPDPRVPIADVNKRGEYAFWRNYEGRHMLLREQAAGVFQWVNHASPTIPKNEGVSVSNRSHLSRGDSHPGSREGGEGGRGGISSIRDFVQVDQGTIDIIPRELGLGDKVVPEKWIFTLLNKDQIVQAEPFDTDHGMHPVAVAEPYSMGYGFGQPGMADYLGPLQDVVSWFFNSHIDNVRKVLNDMLVVDPSMIEMQDLKNPEPGKLVRLKRASYGQDVRQAVSQLNVVDVTGQHVADAQEIIRLGQFLSAVNDNILGVQDSGGRKTATEVRTSGEAAGSRLSAQAKIISGQGVVDLTTIMSLNNQQFLSEEFYLQVVGREGIRKPLRVSPEQLVGDFYYPVNDGTLPQDRVAMLDVWKEILLGIMQDPLGELRQEFSVGRIFEHIAELGGARNIEQFRTDVVPDEMASRQAQAGNIIPMQSRNGSRPPRIAPGTRGRSNAVPTGAGNRIAQALA